jgi:hypothetical protein
MHCQVKQSVGPATRTVGPVKIVVAELTKSQTGLPSKVGRTGQALTPGDGECREHDAVRDGQTRTRSQHLVRTAGGHQPV